MVVLNERRQLIQEEDIRWLHDISYTKGTNRFHQIFSLIHSPVMSIHKVRDNAEKEKLPFYRSFPENPDSPTMDHLP